MQLPTVRAFVNLFFSEVRIYELIAKEIEKLQVNNENCFDNVKVTENNDNSSFDIDTNEKIYMLIKEKDNQFKYVYKSENGEEINVLLEYFFV